jgi:tRNA nucleotidyltransferase (CCA-adding enzyme)
VQGRDLGVENFDLDIVVEGDAIILAQILAKEFRGHLVRHRRFGTATVVLPENLKIDLATARSEYYERPAALPTVKFGTLKDDLYRRDFTINAMAVRLNRNRFGELIDFFAGQEDLIHKRIRILHNLSFVEDPTRIFRAIRFEQRYNFKIDKHTQDLIKKAVGLKMFERVQKQRIREELILLLSEKEPKRLIKRMAQLHQLSFLHPKIKLNKTLIDLLQRIEEKLIWFNSHLPQKRSLDKWLVYLIAIFDQLNYKQTQDTCHKFVFNKGDVKRTLSYKRASPRILKVLSKKGALKPSYIFKLLEPMSYEVILLNLAKSKTRITEGRISDFFTKYNGMRLNITGKDLKRIGLESGPQFKEILNKALYEKIDGKLKSKEDELEFVRRLVGTKTQKSKETSNY